MFRSVAIRRERDSLRGGGAGERFGSRGGTAAAGAGVVLRLSSRSGAGGTGLRGKEGGCLAGIGGGAFAALGAGGGAAYSQRTEHFE